MTIKEKLIIKKMAEAKRKDNNEKIEGYVVKSNESNKFFMIIWFDEDSQLENEYVEIKEETIAEINKNGITFELFWQSLDGRPSFKTYSDIDKAKAHFKNLIGLGRTPSLYKKIM